MMLNTHTSSFQLNSTPHNITPQLQANAMTTTTSNFSNGLSKSQNKLKIAIRPQNEYQVFTNTDQLLQQNNNNNNNNGLFQGSQRKSSHQIKFSTSLIKAPSQGVLLNKSNQNQGLSIMANESHENQYNQLFQKKNSCVGLSITSKGLFGNDKGQCPSPQMPLTAKAAATTEQKTNNNFYFASKKHNINKRTIIKFAEKINDKFKKPSFGITTENSPKNFKSQTISNVPSLIGSSRSTTNALFQDKKSLTRNLTAYLSQNEQSNSNNNNEESQQKSSPNNRINQQQQFQQQQQQQTGNNNNNNNNNHNNILNEYHKLQVSNQKYQLRIQQLEKLCLDQEEQILERDQIIQQYENRLSPLESNTILPQPATSQNSKQSSTKILAKVPSSYPYMNNQMINSEQGNGGISINNSFNTNNDKKYFSGSTAQMSMSLLKSPLSPLRSLLQTSTMSTVKGIPQNQPYSSSTQELISPKTQKYKTKLLSINLQSTEVQDFINQGSSSPSSYYYQPNQKQQKEQFQQQQQQLQIQQQQQFNSQLSDPQSLNLVDQSDPSKFQLNSPNSDQVSKFNFQEYDADDHINENHQKSMQDALNKLLERMKKVLGQKLKQQQSQQKQKQEIKS